MVKPGSWPLIQGGFTIFDFTVSGRFDRALKEPEREMTAFRRVSWNFALDRAVDWTKALQKPLLVLEALRCDYPWAGTTGRGNLKDRSSGRFFT